jgi:hypothetical protein
MGMGHESNDTAAVFDVLEKMSSISQKVAGKKTALRKR